MALGTLPPLVQILTGGRISIGRSDIDIHQTALASWSQIVMVFIVGACSCTAMARKRFTALELHLGSIGIVLCFIGSGIATIYRDDGLGRLSLPLVVQLIVNMLVVTALLSIRISRDELVIFAHLGGLVAMVSLLLAALSNEAWMVGTLTATDTKGLVTTALLAGPYTSMNVLGMVLGMALPFTSLVKRASLRWIYICLMSIALLLSACRSAMVGVCIAAALGILAGLIRSDKGKRRVYAFAAVGIVTVATLLPWIVERDDLFSRRGGVWLFVTQAVEASPFMGWGFNFFGPNSPVSYALGWEVNSAHNLLLNYWIIGGPLGIIGIYLLLIWVTTRVLSLDPFDRTLASFVAILLTLIVVEIPFQLEKFIGLNWIAWPALISVAMVARTHGVSSARESLGIKIPPPHLTRLSQQAQSRRSRVS